MGACVPLLESAYLYMNFLTKCAWACALTAFSLVCLQSLALPHGATVQQVRALGAGSNVEVEISASQPITPRVQVVASPDRLVLDFPNSTPGVALRNLTVNRGAVKAVRVGLFSANPQVTRVVVDLNAPQAYQLFPSGKTIIVKLGHAAMPASASVAAPVSVSTPVPMQASVVIERHPVKQPPRVDVRFTSGKLSIWADRATLAEVLFEVHRKTGADIPIPAGAEQEEVVVQSGPGPARQVLAELLNGSRFDFVMVGSERDAAQLRSVILTPRGAPVPAVIYSGRAEPVTQARPVVAPAPGPGPAPEPPMPEADSAPEVVDQPEAQDAPQ